MQGNDEKSNPLQGNARPLGVLLLNYSLILFSLYQLLKFSQVLLRWEVLSSLALSISPLLQGGEGLIWGFSGIILAWSSWKRKSCAPAAILLAGLIFTLLSWIKLFLLAERVVLENRWPANLVVTIIGISALIGILRLKSTRAYYGKNPVKIT